MHERPDITLLDAPVSGSKDPAEQGQLTIFASGPDGARARVTPALRRARPAHGLGRPGRDRHPLKLVNNTWLAFGPRRSTRRWRSRTGWGSSTETVADALGGGPLVSPWQAAKLQRIVEGDFSPQFPLSLALKDVRLALEAADEDRFAALACLADEWQQVVDQGLGDQDLTVVTRALELHRGRHERRCETTGGPVCRAAVRRSATTSSLTPLVDAGRRCLAAMVGVSRRAGDAVRSLPVHAVGMAVSYL